MPDTLRKCIGHFILQKSDFWSMRGCLGRKRCAVLIPEPIRCLDLLMNIRHSMSPSVGKDKRRGHQIMIFDALNPFTDLYPRCFLALTSIRECHLEECQQEECQESQPTLLE